MAGLPLGVGSWELGVERVALGILPAQEASIEALDLLQRPGESIMTKSFLRWGVSGILGALAAVVVSTATPAEAQVVRVGSTADSRQSFGFTLGYFKVKGDDSRVDGDVIFNNHGSLVAVPRIARPHEAPSSSAAEYPTSAPRPSTYTAAARDRSSRSGLAVAGA